MTSSATESRARERPHTSPPSHSRGSQPAAGPTPDAKQSELSAQTLAFASIGSATAALVTSQLWSDGTVVSAALTPVIVSLVSEGLKRPAKRVSAVRGARRVGAPAPRKTAPAASGANKSPARASASTARQQRPAYRVYGRSRPRLVLALLTGMAAFLVAAVALTVPQLLGGQSLEKTTYFAPSASSESSGGTSSESSGGASSEPSEQTGDRSSKEDQSDRQEKSRPEERRAAPAVERPAAETTPRQGQDQQEQPENTSRRSVPERSQDSGSETP